MDSKTEECHCFYYNQVSSSFKTGTVSNLNESITNEGAEQLFSELFLDVGRVVGRKHRREVEDGHVRLAVVVQGELEIRQLKRRKCVDFKALDRHMSFFLPPLRLCQGIVHANKAENFH